MGSGLIVGFAALTRAWNMIRASGESTVPSVPASLGASEVLDSL